MNNINESIVLVGGGGGVYRVARYLKEIRANITTIQTMFDSGGHSRKLRDERGMLPPGDIRQAILALSDNSIEESLRVLLSHRFSVRNGSSIDNATLGNLMLTALTEHYGSIVVAINELCKLARVKGKVLPVSLDNAHLAVTLSDGSELVGEGLIDTRNVKDRRTIVGAYLKPQADIYVEALDALIKADKIVFCPGDLYTSIIPNTLVNGFKEAIAESEAQLIYAVNIMTKKAETHDFKASMFAKTLLSYLGRETFDAVIVNSRHISSAVRARYHREHSYPVRVDKRELRKYAKQVILHPLVDLTGDIVRHNASIASLIAHL